MSYFDTLYNASFNGIPFVALSSHNEHGRRLAIHRYPNRDSVWPEDMGRRADEFTVEGYVVGDDAIFQRDLMVAACKLPGAGVLIHPTYGILNVNLITLTTVDSYQHGRQIKLSFKFIEAGQQLFPSLLISTFNSILNAIGISDTSSADNFINNATSLIATGQQVVLKGIVTIGTFIALGGGLVKTATNLFSSTSSLAGSFGRFFGASTGSGTGSINGTTISSDLIEANVQILINNAATSQAAVTAAGAAMLTAMQSGTASDVASSIQAYTSTILASVPSPAAAITIFSQLVDFPQPSTLSTGPIGMQQNELQSAITDVARRAAISGLAQASSLYQPTSYNDAQNVRASICAIIDSEILIAADAGEDDVYLALKQLRSAIVQDLTARGATLAAIVQQNFGDTLPALAVAYRLYEDITRTDQIIAFADPIHPAFLPSSFQALSS